MLTAAAQTTFVQRFPRAQAVFHCTASPQHYALVQALMSYRLQQQLVYR